MTDETLVRVSPAALVRDVSGSSVLLNVETGEYFSLERGLALGTGGAALDVDGLGTAGFDAIVASELSGFGFGINQNLNSVVDLYVSYRHISPDATLASAAGATEKAALEDFDYVTAGAYIKF